MPEYSLKSLKDFEAICDLIDKRRLVSVTVGSVTIVSRAPLPVPVAAPRDLRSPEERLKAKQREEDEILFPTAVGN